jgi:hypothetical protein
MEFFLKRREQYRQHQIISITIALIQLIVSTVALLSKDFYQGAYSSTLGDAIRGLDLISLLAAVALIAVIFMTKNGSVRAFMVWPGLLFYLLYTNAIFAFDGVYTGFYFLYIALLGLSTFALGSLLLNLDTSQIRRTISGHMPANAISVFFVLVAIILVPAWLSMIVPAITNRQSLFSNAVFVLELAYVIPALIVTVLWLRKHRTWGFIMAGILLIKATSMGLIVTLGETILLYNHYAINYWIAGFFLVFTLAGAYFTFIYLSKLHLRLDK